MMSGVAKQRAATTKTLVVSPLKKRGKGALLREEVWRDGNGNVLKYSLAYINPSVCGLDNGRVLGYDNSHDYHHRHFMGVVARIGYESYESLLERFEKELGALEERR
jgi:hypothetical protein